MDDIPTKKLLKAFIADMDPFTKKFIKVFVAIVLLMLIYKYIWWELIVCHMIWYLFVPPRNSE